MDTNRVKKAAQWFYNTVFRDEPIRPRTPAAKLPPLLQTARSLESSGDLAWQSRESVFLKQGKLLANYRDSFEFDEPVTRYYPTYQSLSDRELRGYFSWRTRLRDGDLCKTSLSFAFLYIYELLNQIGVADAMDGYRRLTAFREEYGRLDNRISHYLDRWIPDYVIYYGLDPELLAHTPQVIWDRAVTVLDQIDHQPPEKVIFALRQLSGKWLGRSRFYQLHSQDMDPVLVSILTRVSARCASRCKHSMTDQYFGTAREYPLRLFDAAVFYDRFRNQVREYPLDERCIYRCQGGLWTVTRHPCLPEGNGQLCRLVKTVDALMREASGFGHPIQHETQTKWLLKLIREEIQAHYDRKKAEEAKKPRLDLSQLERIRQDAAVTQQRLTVDEEAELPPMPEPPPTPAEPAPPLPDSPLSAPEYRLLQCLLSGSSTDWVRTEGHMLSVLADSINEKLYETFLDAVLDEDCRLIEDYTDQLKEMIAL